MTRAGPLAGIRVLDFTHAVAGFFCTLQLGDLGADVLKVEPPTGNPLRRDEPRVLGESVNFMANNRNKRSIVLDLKHEAGRRIARELALRSDVVVSNFRPGVMERLGLGYDELRAHNTRLIYAALSGYGTSGPYHTRAAYDPAIQAMSGVMSLTGEPAGSAVVCGLPIADLTAGTFLAQGVVTALYARGYSGQGTRVDVAMLDALMYYLTAYFGPAYLADGRVYERLGNSLPYFAPSGAFPATDGQLIVAARTDDQFRRLCEALDAEEWAQDERFATEQARLAHREELHSLLEDRFRTRTRAAWLERLDEHGIVAGPVNTVKEALSDPAIRERVVLQQDHPCGGSVAALANPVRLDGARPERHDAAPLFGAHTLAVLRELGCSEQEIRTLLEQGVVVAGSDD